MPAGASRLGQEKGRGQLLSLPSRERRGQVCAGRGQPLGQEDGRGQLLSLPGSERRGQGLCRQGPAPGPEEQQPQQQRGQGNLQKSNIF